MSEAPCCPTCGQTLKTDRSEVMALMGLKVSIMQKSVLRELIKVWPGSVRVEDLVWGIWQGTDEPDTARESILIYVHRLRKVLPGHGWNIINLNGRGRGAPAEYTLKSVQRPVREYGAQGGRSEAQ